MFNFITVREYKIHEHKICDFHSYKFVKACFMTQKWSTLEFVPCTLIKNVFSWLLGGSFCKYQLGQACCLCYSGLP